MTDSAGNSYAKACEFTNGQGSAAAGITISLWWGRLSNQLSSGGTITANFANSIVAKAMNGWEYTVGAGIEMVGSCQTEAVDGSGGDGLGSMAISGLSSAETLFVRVAGHESNSATAITVTTNYTTLGFVRADSGTNSTSARALGEFRIVTATGETSDPSLTTSFDTASVMAAFREQVAAGAKKRRAQTIVVD
jgi:hypothetical protein